MMRKNSSMIIKTIVTLTIVASTLSTTAFAAWGWETPGYEWAREKKLTSIANTSTLNNKVSHANFYSTLIRYLQLKGVRPKQEVKQNVLGLNTFNKALEGIAQAIDEYISRDSLTPQEYREVVTYMNHLYSTVKDANGKIVEIGTLPSNENLIMPNNKNLITRDSLKDLYLYMALAKYKAATLISEPTYKNIVMKNLGPTAMYNVGTVKYKEIIDYNIKPYYGDISRREFLILMFSLLSEQNLSEEEVLTQFNDAGVLVGYENGSLELEQPLTYAEMFTFLRRFEIFDFNPEPEVEEGTNSEDEVKEYN